MAWDLWIDFQQGGAEGITSTLAEHARPGLDLHHGTYALVGSEDADLAVAEIAEVRAGGVVLTRVLPGPATNHLELLERSHQGS